MTQPNPGPFRAVLFDLDGTLLDTIEDIAFSLNSVLERHGYPTHTVDECRLLVGYGMQELVRSSLPEEAHAEPVLMRMQAEMKQAYAEHWKDRSMAFDGIGRLLDAIGEMHLKRAILSNKPDGFTRLCADELLAGWSFDVVMGHHDGIAHKPDPQGALLIAGMLGVEPAQVLYVGDSGTDMKTAVAAGMYPVGVLWGYRDEEELLADGAEAVVEKPEEIIEILRKANSR